QRYLAAAKKIFPDSNRDTLPWDVGLRDAMLLLYVVEDEFLPAADIKNVRGVSHVQNLVSARNGSVLAHGVKSVTQEQCDDLKARALRNLRAFWKLHHSGENLNNW